MKPSRDIARLIEIMAALRTPDTGCPWDLEQNFGTIAPYTIEEAYEVADAIARGDLDDLRDELGDLLLQVVFHARMAQEQGAFDFGDVVQAITEKLMRRHPHVFGDTRDLTPDAGQRPVVTGSRPQEKAERAARRRERHAAADNGALAGRSAPDCRRLARALKLQAKAGKVGFDWNDPKAVLDKIAEEADEISAAIDGGDHDASRRGNRRSDVRSGQSRAAPERRSGDGVARRQCEIRTPLCEHRERAGRQGQSAAGGNAWPKWTRSGTRPRRRKSVKRPVLAPSAAGRPSNLAPDHVRHAHA